MTARMGSGVGSGSRLPSVLALAVGAVVSVLIGPTSLLGGVR